jgi:hypothetical protein
MPVDQRQAERFQEIHAAPLLSLVEREGFLSVKGELKAFPNGKKERPHKPWVSTLFQMVV